jgi:hypothetical protein
MSLTAKMLGVAIPVVVATSLCLTVPFILLVADGAILAAAVVYYATERRAARVQARASLPELE